MINTEIRNLFPMLQKQIHEQNLIYFDNAATTQKPYKVIQAIQDFYSNNYASSHGIHSLARETGIMVERTREKIAGFIKSKSAKEVVFTKGATESINLVAYHFEKILKKSDNIIISIAEHHANLIPWQRACKQTGATLKHLKINQAGDFDLQALEDLMDQNTKLVALTHCSNVIGKTTPIKQIAKIVHKNKSLFLVDGTQAIVHQKIDVNDLDIDFYVFSAHKMFGPTGIGILYCKYNILENLEPYQVGGEMIESVNLESATFAKAPQKFEAGTLNFAGIVGFEAAIDFCIEIEKKYDLLKIEKDLTSHFNKRIVEVEGVNIIGQNKTEIPLFSFYFENVNGLDLAYLLDSKSIAVRTGKHCAEPLHDFYKINSSLRASLTIYNTISEIDIFIETLKKQVKKLQR
jgi:cysteine desulfurase/selenocysteine lyase